MAWDAVAKLSSLLEQFRTPPVGWNCELLNARWRNFRHDMLCEGGLWLPSPSEPAKLIAGFVYLWDETLGEPVQKNGKQASYSTATELAAEEFRRLAILGGDIINRIPQLKSELQPFVDGSGDGPPADNERWWLAYLFREVASKIEGQDLNIEAVGLGNGLTYEVCVEGLFRASESACERLLELVGPAVVGACHQTQHDKGKETFRHREQQQVLDGDIMRRLAELFGDTGGEMLAVIQKKDWSVDMKLRKMERIDPPRFENPESDWLAGILDVSGQAVRKTDWWREKQKKSDE